MSRFSLTRWGLTRLGLCSALVALSVPLAGCKKAPEGPMPICEANVAAGTATESEAQELPADIWFSILLKGFDRTQRLAGDDPRDCVGDSALAPTPPPLPSDVQPEEGADPNIVAGCNIGPDESIAKLPARPLTEEDVVINKGPEGKSLVWVQATHYENGEASGPVAMVEWTTAGVAVRALGTLRAHTKKARMRIEMAEGTQMLVVESDMCNEELGKLCIRILKILPNIGGRFVTVPLKIDPEEDVERPADADPCLGNAEFALMEQYTSNLPDGWIREFVINRSVTFEGGAPLISEQVKIKDKDPEQPDAPAQDFRQAANDRTLRYTDRFFATRSSVWDEMIQEYGSVAHDADAEDEDE